MINRNKIKKILVEYNREDNGDVESTVANPVSFSRSSVGNDFRNEIFGLEDSNALLLQFISNVNNLLINSPREFTLLTKQLQTKLPETLRMLQELDPDTKSQIMNKFVQKLKIDFFSLYAMTSTEYKENGNNEPELEPVIDDEPTIDATIPDETVV